MCAQLTPGGLHFRVHEPSIWGLADFYERLQIGRIAAATAAGVGGSSGGGGGGGGGGSSPHLNAAATATAAAAEDPAMALGIFSLSPMSVGCVNVCVYSKVA